MKCAFENVKKSYPEAFCRGFTNDKDILPGLRGFRWWSTLRQRLTMQRFLIMERLDKGDVVFILYEM
jgi:hypothetical protein